MLLLAMVLPLCECSLLRSLAPERHSGAHLVVDLRRDPDNVDLCEPNAARSRVGILDREDLEDLMYGLRKQSVELTTWVRCVRPLLTGLPPERAADLLDLMGEEYRSLIRDGRLGENPVLKARFGELHLAFLERPNSAQPHATVMTALLDDLRQALKLKRIGEFAIPWAQELLSTQEEMEQGRWQGVAVTAATLEGFATGADETLLRRLARRLPDPALREQARRVLVRRHLQQSPFPELIGEEGAELMLLQTGHYPVPLSRFPPVEVRVDRERFPMRSFRVHQQVSPYLATLTAYNKEAELPALPEVPLRGKIHIRLTGLARPVSFCGPPRADDIDLDATPCVSAVEFTTGQQHVRINRDGVLLFTAEYTEAPAAALATACDALRAPLIVKGTPLLVLSWPLRFLAPPKSERTFVANGQGPPGSPGPDLEILADHGAAARLALHVEGVGLKEPYFMVMERDEASSFRVISRGVPGEKGTPGTAGAPGVAGPDGKAAVCPGGDGEADGFRGGEGDPGGNGEPGGRGGDGGRMRIRVRCGARPCDEVIGMLTRILHSEGAPGGEGGEGGPGGPGGEGGEGGAGTECVVDEAKDGKVWEVNKSVSSGKSGHSGTAGRRGRPGPRGQSGTSWPPQFYIGGT